MAIEKTYLLGKNITLGCGFDLQAKAPLDSRQIVPEYAGLQALITGNAAYEGMIVYDEETKKTYQAQIIDGVLAFREFGMTEQELREFIASETTAAMEFKGAAATLPTNPTKGDFYKVTASFEVAGEMTKVGDSIVYDGEQWFVIPSGDDIEDTWRPVTDVDNDATLTFAAGEKLDVVVATNGTVTYSHETVAAPTATPVGENEQTRTYLTSIETDGYGHITGYKTATENVEDTNTTYTFEGQSEDATSVYFQVTSSEENADTEVIYLDTYSKNEANEKFVAKETGKSLISDAEIARLAEVDNYDDEEVRGLVGANAQAIEDLETYVGTIPNVPGEDGNNKYADLDVIGYINKKAQETLAAASGNSSETAASVKGQLDDYIGENNTRVEGIEEAIEAINDTENGILKQAQNYADGLASNYDAAGTAAGVQTALEAEIAKKVDKVEGKSLVSDTEITKLAGVSEGANKVEASATNGNIKIDGVETTVYTHPEKHAIEDVTGLQDALDGKQAAGNYSEVGHKHVKADITDFAHTHTASEITDLDTTIKGYNYATKTEAEGYANAKDQAIADAKKAGDDAQDAVDALAAKVGTVEDGKTVVGMISAFETATDERFTTAEEFINDNTSNIQTLTETVNAIYKAGEGETAASGVLAEEIARAIAAEAKVLSDAKDYTDAEINGIKLDMGTTEDGNDAILIRDKDDNVICELDASIFIQDSFLNNVTYDAQTRNMTFVWSMGDGSDKSVIINVGDLVDTYTAGTGLTLANNEFAVDTTVIATVEELNKVKQTAEDAQTAQEVSDAIDAKITALKLGETYAAKEHTHTASEITDFATEVAKVKVNEAVKATQDGNGKVIADTYAEKATTLAGYGITDAYAKTETYTQEEVNTLIQQATQWGEF